jgi:methylated-DNA-[protein]-cysteine S-methyltransferase
MAAMVRTTFDTPVGRFGVLATEAGVRAVLLPSSKRRRATLRGVEPAAEAIADQAATQLPEYLDGDRREFDFPLDWSLAADGRRVVLETLRDIAPYGHVVTYGELARRSGCPGGARAVGQAMARNPLPLVVPCHRVVAADGLGGYGGGLPLKRWLLALEGAITPELPSVPALSSPTL